MISWTSILFGAVLSAVFAVVAVFLAARERDRLTLALVIAGALVGPIGWNAVLHGRNARGFFIDAPIGAFPVSWQDVGSGVWTLAAASVLLGLRGGSPRRIVVLSVLTALVALLVDVYLY